MTAFISIVSEEYLPYYRVLFESLKKHANNPYQILYYVGEPKPELNTFDKVVNITHWYDGCNPSYNKLERICSLRAQVVMDAFNLGYEQVVFTGAKVEFFQYPYKLLDPLSVLQDAFNAVVTPHILEPLPDDGKWPSNASVSFTGHISTDVVSFRKCPEIWQFLMWQNKIMENNVKTTGHTYLDQSWLNFLPFFVDNVKILRDPSYNCAYWNYKQRALRKSDPGVWLVDDNYVGKPMVCFQYSGLDLNDPKRISTHQNRYEAEGDFLKFLEDYARKVK